LRQMQQAQGGYGQQTQQQQRASQQRAQEEALLRQMQQEAILRAQQKAMLDGYNGMPAGMGQTPMSTKEKKKLQKEQEKAAAQKKKDAEARIKAFKEAQKRAASGRGRAAVTQRKGPLGMLFSFKGLALTATVGYLSIAQRELVVALGGLLFKYPLLVLTWFGRTLLNVLVKPILLRLVSLKGGGGSDVLPGGSY